MIERIHLHILFEIDRQGSLTSAAKALHLTQSALSHTIKKLEAQIGMSLWDKKGRNIKFTQAGDYLLKEAKRLLPQLERVDKELQYYARGEQGELRIGMECHPCYQWLLKVTHQFLNQHPGVDIDVKQKFQFGGIAALYNHEIDLLVTPDPIIRQGITFTPVFDYEQVLVVSTDHPFARRNTINPEDLVDQTLYTYPVNIERLDIYTLFLLPKNCLPKQRKIIETTEIMLQFVAANRGIATLPRWLVEEYQQRLPLSLIRLGELGLKKQIHLGKRESEEGDSSVVKFVNLAKSRFMTKA